jgi:hypothetical protein
VSMQPPTPKLSFPVNMEDFSVMLSRHTNSLATALAVSRMQSWFAWQTARNHQ